MIIVIMVFFVLCIMECLWVKNMFLISCCVSVLLFWIVLLVVIFVIRVCNIESGVMLWWL